jgi:hypothetical protein
MTTFSNNEVAQQSIISSTIKNRDNRIAEAASRSGFKMKFALSEVNGIKMLLPSSISWSPMPSFNGTVINTKVESSKGWSTLSDWGKYLMWTVLGYKGIGTFGDIMTGALAAKAGDVTFGGTANLYQSLNKTKDGAFSGMGQVFHGGPEDSYNPLTQQLPTLSTP